MFLALVLALPFMNASRRGRGGTRNGEDRENAEDTLPRVRVTVRARIRVSARVSIRVRWRIWLVSTQGQT